METTSQETTPLRRSTHVPLPQDAFRLATREYDESVAAARGVIFGLVLVAPVWTIIAAAIFCATTLR